MSARCFTSILFAIVIVSMSGLVTADEESSPYSKAVASYFEVAAEKLAAVSETEIAEEEIPVALFVAQTTKGSPVDIAKLRVRGDSWADILRVRNVEAGKFYMLISAPFESKTYTPIFAKFKLTPESQWGKIVLSDEEIVNLVNLRFISSHYDYSAFKVMEMRDGGASFQEISKRVAEARAEMIKKEKEEEKQRAKKAGSD